MNKNGQDSINEMIANFVVSERAETLASIKVKIQKSKAEQQKYEEKLKDEKNQLQIALKKIYNKQGNSFKKLTELSFVEHVEKNNNNIKICTIDLIVDKKYNLGPYIITISKQTIKATRLNGRVNDLHHCFINKNGSICYGDTNISKSISEWKKAGLYHLAVAVIWDTLSNIPVGSKPYKNIKDFYAELKQKEK